MSERTPWLLWILMLLGWLSALGQDSSADSGSVLTTAAAVRGLSVDLADRKIECRLRGVVTASSRANQLLFVQDSTGGVYVYSPEDVPNQGAEIEVVGTSDRGRFSPIVMARELRILGTKPLPRAPQVPMEKLATGRFDAQWVEIEGVVVRQAEEWGYLTLILACGNSRTPVRILSFQPGVPDWVDARVRVQGVAGTAYNDQRQLTGFHLLTQSTNWVTIIKPPLGDPFAAPLRSSRNLMAFSPSGETDHRARLRGVVTWSWPGHGFYLRDAEGDVRVHTVDTNVPPMGRVVDVSGFAVPTLNRPHVTEAVFRVSEETNPVEPRKVTPDELARGAADAQLVTIEGTVIQIAESHSDHVALLIAADDRVVRCRYQAPWFQEDLSHWNGATVRVTGVFTQDSSPQSPGESSSIWLRSADDLVVVKRSPVWNQRLALGITGGLAGGVVVGSAWLALVCQRVRQRALAIQQREQKIEAQYVDLFENANDIVFSHDLQGRMTALNGAGEALLNCPDINDQARTIDEFLDPRDKSAYQAHVQSLLQGKTRERFDLRLQSSTGRINTVEMNTRLIFQDGQPAGVQAIARDITGRKLAEAALKASERQLRASIDERERLGRDLHDGIIQSIYAVGIRLEDLRTFAGPQPAEFNARLQQVTGELNRVIRQLRGFIQGLEQNKITGDEFKAALKTLVVMAGERPLPIEVQIEDRATAELDSHQATQLLNIAREALSNSVRHSQAAQIALSLRHSADGVRFEVRDDGIGFDLARVPSDGRGLKNIAARARDLAAQLSVDSRPGRGTRIEITLPPRSPSENSTPDCG